MKLFLDLYIGQSKCLPARAEITYQPKSKQITLGDLFVPQVSINFLACSKGFKYKRISNKNPMYVWQKKDEKKIPAEVK